MVSSCPLCLNKKVATYFVSQDEIQKIYLQCSLCDLIFLRSDFHLSFSDEKMRYDLHENKIDDPDYLSFLNRLVTPLTNYIDSSAKGLDFGCGRVKAIELLLNQKGICCQSYDPYYYPDLGLLNDNYDFITMSEVIEHIYQPSQIIRQLWGILNENGILAIMTCFHDGKDFSSWWYKNDPTHVCFYSKKTFQYLADYLKAKAIYSKNIVLLIK